MSLEGETVSHYEVISQLGGGGMGVVYKARDTKLDRFVALKFLPPELSTDPEANERFIVEAKAASALDHNNICTIYEIGETDEGRLFIAMPFYDGQTLKYWLQNGPRTELESLEIVRQVAEGLAAAHEKGIVHRDIKPANIMVTEKGRAVILDFGLAKLPGVLSLTKTGSTLGTAAYMAPEQIRGDEVDARSDIWSLGVVFYQLLAGARPFEAEYEQALSYAILNQEVTPPHGVSSDVSQILTRMLEKEASRRYSSVQDLIQALEDAIDARKDSSDGSRSVETVDSNRKRRNRFAGIGVAIATVVVVLAVVILMLPGSPTQSELDENVIAIMPFSVRGDPDLEYLETGIVDLLSIRLDGAGAYRTVDPNGLLGLMAKEGIDVTTPNDAVGLAHRFGAASAIMGTIIGTGGKIEINVTLYTDPAAPDIDVAVTAAEEEMISQSVDEIAGELAIALTDLPLEAAESVEAMTSSNFKALKAYLAGSHAFSHGRYEEAIEFLDQAVAADTSFALPYTLLPVAHGWLGRRDRERDAWRRGYELRDSLPPRTRSFMEAGYASFVAAEPEKAMELYRTLLGRYPHDVAALMGMGETVYHYNPLLGKPQSESRQYLEEWAALTDDVSPLQHLAPLAARARRFAEAESLATIVVQAIDDPSVYEFNSNMRGIVSRQLGDSSWTYDGPGSLAIYHVRQLAFNAATTLEDPEAFRMISEVAQADDSYPHGQRVNFAFFVGQSYQMEGRLRENARALKSIDPAFLGWSIVDLSLTHGIPVYPIYHDIVKDLRAMIASWDTLSQKVEWPIGYDLHPGEYHTVKTYLQGLLAFRDGDSLSFANMVDTLLSMSRPDDKANLAHSLMRSLQGIEAFSKGDYDSAIEAMDDVRLEILWRDANSPIKEQVYNRLIKAESLFQKGDLETALQVFMSIMGSDFGGKIRYLGPGYLRLAQIHEQLGNLNEAIYYYSRLVHTWKHCDPELVPMREDARTSLDRLLARSVQEPS